MLFGSHDIIAFVEVMRVPEIMRVAESRGVLSELSDKIRTIRGMRGVVSTETLVDFSQMARFKLAAGGGSTGGT